MDGWSQGPFGTRYVEHGSTCCVLVFVRREITESPSTVEGGHYCTHEVACSRSCYLSKEVLLSNGA